ncbi:MAG: flagellar biosynthetic protein FliO [Caldimicrobium sp.]|nr:flagellar biosynthetic protein FliO [Caldimicrobium sp.]MCX7874097.1 flagellar biosynthetic protein FliO [Caldimicrobium sp.]MDW8093768.1 flagellar biosynthetic protein FliO [Caldimicrobium sp.]
MEWINYIQGLGVLFLILSALPLVSYLYSRFQKKSIQSSQIKILEIKPIAYKAQLMLIEIEGRKLLIGLSDKGFSYLGEFKSDS